MSVPQTKIRALNPRSGRQNMLRVVCVVFVLGLAQGPAISIAEMPEIWSKAISPQPFDKFMFQQIRIPDWVQDTIGCGYTLSVMDTAARERAVSHGVTISEMGFVDPFYAYYDSRLLKRRSPHVSLERLKKDITEYRRLGVRILGVYPPCLQGEVYETRPEWRRIATNTTEIPQIDLKQFPHGGMLCLLGPYGDFFIEVLAEILTLFPEVDAFSFDGLHYGGVCYCQHCRQAYRHEMQSEIPNPDLNNRAFRRYQHWADRRMEDLVRRMQTRIKGIKPTVALVTWTTNAGRFGHFLSIPRNMPSRMNLLLDAPDQEFWLDETNRGSTIVPAFANSYIWATTNHRVAFSEPYLMSHGNPYGRDSFPPHEILRRMLLAATHGAAPSIAVSQQTHFQQDLYDCMDQIQQRKAWLTHKSPEPWAALVMSDNTRNFYGRSAGQVEEHYLAHVFGTFRVAMEEHLQVTVINDWNLNEHDLSNYKVLLLPNTACLDEKQVAAIDRFVRQGGGLVASLDASLFNEFGDPRENFALEEAFGTKHQGIIQSQPQVDTGIDINFAKTILPDYWEKRKNTFELRLNPSNFLEQGLPVATGQRPINQLARYLGNGPVTFKGPAVQVSVIDSQAQILGTIVAKTDQHNTPAPAAIARKHGKGKVVYFPAGFDAAYYLYAYPYERLLLREAINWVSHKPQGVKIKAPLCVQSNVLRQAKGGQERLLIHLFNNVNTTAFHALPNDDVPLREETLPIYGIQIDLDSDYEYSRIHQEPEGIDLTSEKTVEGTNFVVPKLELHSIVVIELNPRKSP